MNYVDRILNMLSQHQKSEEPLTAFCCVAEIRVWDRPCRNACPVLLLSDHGELETGLN